MITTLDKFSDEGFIACAGNIKAGQLMFFFGLGFRFRAAFLPPCGHTFFADADSIAVHIALELLNREFPTTLRALALDVLQYLGNGIFLFFCHRFLFNLWRNRCDFRWFLFDLSGVGKASARLLEVTHIPFLGCGVLADSVIAEEVAVRAIHLGFVLHLLVGQTRLQARNAIGPRRSPYRKQTRLNRIRHSALALHSACKSESACEGKEPHRPG